MMSVWLVVAATVLSAGVAFAFPSPPVVPPNYFLERTSLNVAEGVPQQCTYKSDAANDQWFMACRVGVDPAATFTKLIRNDLRGCT